MITTITAILAKIGVGKAVAGVLGTMVLPFLFKTIRARVTAAAGAFFAKELDKAFHPDMNDPVKKAAFINMVKGIVAYAELCVPDSGMGDKKMAFVKGWLMRFMPEKYADEIVGIINAAVVEMDAVLKAKAKDSK